MQLSTRAIIPFEGKYLVVRNKASGDFWCLPGGKMEDGEDVISTLRREIIEETGVEPVIGNLLFVHQFMTADGYTLPSFIYHVKNGKEYFDTDFTKASHSYELVDIAFKDIYTLDDFRPWSLAGKLRSIEKQGFEVPAQILLEDK